MMEIRAIPFRQSAKDGEKEFYLAVLQVKDVLQRMKVDRWSPNNTEGYQRALQPRRVGDAAWYLEEAEAFFPTSILLAIRDDEVSVMREDDGTVTLALKEKTPLWVIDGQHRLAGLEKAVSDGHQQLFDNYELPATIFLTPSKTDEIRTFYLVNSRAKSVPADIADRILQKTLSERGMLEMLRTEAPQDRRAMKAVLRARATNVVDALRTQCPVWQDMVTVPGEPKPSRFAVRQHTLVASLLEKAFKDHSLVRFPDEDLAKLLHRYWCALQRAFPEAMGDPAKYSIRKTPGLYSLHALFPDVFERGREARDYTEDKMFEALKGMGLDSSFWSTGLEIGDPRTFGTGMKSMRLLANYLRGLLPNLSLAGL